MDTLTIPPDAPLVYWCQRHDKRLQASYYESGWDGRTLIRRIYLCPLCLQNRLDQTDEACDEKAS